MPRACNPSEKGIIRNHIITLSHSTDSSRLITGALTTQYSKLSLIIYISKRFSSTPIGFRVSNLLVYYVTSSFCAVGTPLVLIMASSYGTYVSAHANGLLAMGVTCEIQRCVWRQYMTKENGADASWIVGEMKTWWVRKRSAS